jgi:hypothetical protein
MSPNTPLTRHTGEGRYPAMKKLPQVRVLLGLQPLTTTAYPLRVRGHNFDVVPLAWKFFDHLDSGLRRNDVVSLMEKLG